MTYSKSQKQLFVNADREVGHPDPNMGIFLMYCF